MVCPRRDKNYFVAYEQQKSRTSCMLISAFVFLAVQIYNNYTYDMQNCQSELPPPIALNQTLDVHRRFNLIT